MRQSNPFQQTMTKMQIGPDMGPSISIRGFEVEADADGVLEVPKELVAELKCHGLKDYVEKAAPAKK